MDLRNGWMPPPYNEKGQYVNSAVVIQPIEVPCHLFNDRNSFWEAARYIAKIWDVARKRKGMVATIESEAGAFLKAKKRDRHVDFSILEYAVLTRTVVLHLQQQCSGLVRISYPIHQDLNSLTQVIPSLGMRICSLFSSRIS